MSMKKNFRKNKPEGIIREVYNDNFVEEIKEISKLIENYKYIAMDTEFPGVVFQSQSNNRESYYKSIKQNVDKLKLIQVGITLSDENGIYPHGVRTWQFNLRFDLNNDQYSNESIALLTNSGINFEMLENRGILPEVFGEYMISSGLLLNEEIYWISFHGIYDFAYILKCVSNLNLPDTELNFFENLKIYFPNYYDIRFLVRYNDSFRGSLSKLGQELNIARIGTQHQAGSDSHITSEIFFKLKKEYLSEDSCKADKNVLYGIGLGLDEDSIYQNGYYGNYKINNYSYDYGNFYQMNMQYNYLRNNPGYFPNNYNYQYNTLTNIPYSINEDKKRFNSKGVVED